MLLVVICVAYVISDVSTHLLPIMYYEGFFTYLYGVSIFFLLYVFCFLLQGNNNEENNLAGPRLVFPANNWMEMFPVNGCLVSFDSQMYVGAL